MFTIDSNQVIRITNGDDVKFPLFVNRGTATSPIRYAFYQESIELEVNPKTLIVNINKETWKSKVLLEGSYLFIYNGTNWIYNSQIVNMSEYGITITGTVASGNSIKVTYEKTDGCYVKFIIYRYDDRKGDIPVLVKTFNTNGTTVIQRVDQSGRLRPEIIESIYKNVNENHDMIIRLANLDTLYLPNGEYKYQVQAKVIDRDVTPIIDPTTGVITYTYLQKTITNKLPIYIINDNYSERIWR